MKALLIVDIPNKYSIDELKADVYINHKGFNVYKRRRTKLKPTPQRRSIFYGKADEIDENIGFNKCIDEITGKEES